MFARRFIIRQFGKPEGWLGALAGLIMAYRPSNRRRNVWAVGLLDIAPDDRVIEIGCGPGIALNEIAGHLETGTVAGIDHSRVMIGQARRRNRDAIRSGRVTLTQGGLDDLPRVDGGYTKALAVNILQFQSDLNAACAAIAAVLAPGGLLAVAYQPRLRRATHNDAAAFGDRLAVALSHAGFTDIRMEELALRPAPAICVIGRRTDGTAR